MDLRLSGNSDDRIASLEAFLFDNSEFELLEQLVNPFNVFEAIGVTRQELRHSDFLAFLLDPSQNHGLADTFTRRFLQAAIRGQNRLDLPMSAIELDVSDLDQVEIRREWQNIDILVRDARNRCAFLIENKVGSAEHDDQLRRYWDAVSREHPGWRTVGIFLSPDGAEPSDTEHYLPMSYRAVAETIDAFVDARSSAIGAEVGTLLKHYTQMLRRHVVEDSEVARLCQQIYQKHRSALDLIFEHRPDAQAQICELLKSLIETHPDLTEDHSTKSLVRFADRSWDQTDLTGGTGWTPSGRMLLFEFGNRSDRLTLTLYLGPGPEEIRRRLFDFANTTPPLKPTTKSLNRVWNALWQRQLLTSAALAGSWDDIQTAIEQQWSEFTQHDLPQLRHTLEPVTPASNPSLS